MNNQRQITQVNGTRLAVAPDMLQMDVKPIPVLMPGIEQAGLAHYDDELDPNLVFRPPGRQLLMTNTGKILGAPLRFFRVLNSSDRVHLVLVVPRGELARWERQQSQIGMELAEIKAAIQDLQTAIVQEQQAQRQREIELIRAIERSRRQAVQQVSRSRRLPLDPVVPATSVPLPPYIMFALRRYYWHMISWRDEFSLQQNLAWGETSRTLAAGAIRCVQHGLKAALRSAEIDWLCHFLDFCISDPGMWYLKVSEED